MITIWGLKNCDSCRKARKWLDERDVEYQFYDVRIDGLNESKVSDWLNVVGQDILINRRGTTWRDLPDDLKEKPTEKKILALLVQYPALIKRPVFEAKGRIFVGFTEQVKTDLI